MFQNYSQTYAAAITALVGVVVMVLGLFHINVVASDLELALGSIVNLVGIIWVMVNRYRKGDVTPLGSKK